MDLGRSGSGWPESAQRPDAYLATEVMRRGGRIATRWDQLRSTSPLLILGDSFTNVPHDYGVDGANIPAHLEKLLGIVPRLSYHGGGAPRTLSILAADPTILSGVKVAVLCFSETYIYPTPSTDASQFWPLADIPTE